MSNILSKKICEEVHFHYERFQWNFKDIIGWLPLKNCISSNPAGARGQNDDATTVL